MVSETRPDPEAAREPDTDDTVVQPSTPAAGAVEHGGRNGPDPTRYGDWEKNGRCIDF
ncbi:MAG: DUF1674 domain-containing protein [Luteimonas sp.]